MSEVVKKKDVCTTRREEPHGANIIAAEVKEEGRCNRHRSKAGRIDDVIALIKPRALLRTRLTRAANNNTNVQQRRCYP